MGLVLLFSGSGGAGGAAYSAGAATNLYFIFNDAGDAATAIPVLAGSTADGYEEQNIITGPRSTMWRSELFANAEIGLTYGGDVPITHFVITRADLFASAAGKHLVGQMRDSGGTWHDIPGFSYNITDISLLVGPTSQDMVIETSPSDKRGVAIFTEPLSGTEAMQFSKLCAGTAFQFSVPPRVGLSWRNLTRGTLQTPMRGTLPYEVERSFSLLFQGVGQSEVTSFLASTQLFRWPFFLYDSTGDIWQWKLEHVLLTDILVEILGVDNYAVQLEFARLRHYD